MSERILVPEPLADQRLVDDRHLVPLLAVPLLEVAPPQDGDAEGAEEPGAGQAELGDPVLSRRRRRPARDGVAAVGPGFLDGEHGDHRRRSHLRQAPHPLEQRPIDARRGFRSLRRGHGKMGGEHPVRRETRLGAAHLEATQSR